MTLPELVITTLVSFAASSVGIAAAIYLAKALLSNWLAQALEAHKVQLTAQANTELAKTQADLRVSTEQVIERLKADLKASYDREVETLKAELRVAAHQKERTFELLSERRLEVIAELYKMLVTTVDLFRALTMPLRLAEHASPEQLYEPTMKAWREFGKFYREHKVFLTQALAEKIDGLERDFVSVHIDFTFYPLRQELDRINTAERFRLLKEVWNKTDKKIPATLADIELEFRGLLGVHVSPP